METSLFERLIIELKLDAEFLDTQYRMHPELAAFPSKFIYGGNLKSGTLATECPKGLPWPTHRPLAIVNLPGRRSGSTFSNPHEAQLEVTLDIVKGFLAGGFVVKDIAILCTYKEQVTLYENETEGNEKLGGIVVETVDGSQGSEWPIVILNTVRAGCNSFGHTRDKRRVNVSMTRGQQAFILVCDVSFMKKEKHIWGEYIEEHESTIVKDTDLEDYLLGEGEVTQKKLQTEVVLRQNGYLDDG